MNPRRALLLRLLRLACVAGPASLAAGAGSAGAAPHACPGSNSPNGIVVAGGSGQTAQLGTPFATPLQVKLVNTNGCPLTGNLAGYDIDFDAPGSGPSGFFAGSGGREAVVGTDANGVATAPVFTANFTSGAYTVDAHSDFGSVELYLSNSAAGLPAAVSAVIGTPQEANVNSQYGQPLRARVTDANGSPVQGAVVSFSVVIGPYGAGGSFLAGGAQASAKTDSSGLATSPPLLANGSPGRFTAVASTDGVPGVASYSLDNHAATNTLAADVDPAQVTTIDTRYPRPLTARFLDPAGQPLEGATVTFTLGSSGGGSGGGGAGGTGASSAGASFLNGSSQAIVLTDQDGLATSPPFLANGTPGDFTATATVAGVTVPAGYKLHNLPARLAATDPPASATVGRNYRNTLRARVRDAHGKPVDGATVTFTIGKADNGATASFPDGAIQTTATTNSEGIARSPALTANNLAGSFAATATLSGSRPIHYTLRNRAAAPAAVAAGAANGQWLPIGTQLPLRLGVTVTDADGNPVAGATVTFTAPTAGPGGTFTTYSRNRKHRSPKTPVAQHLRVVHALTDGKGVAIAPPFTANTQTGGYAVTVHAGRARTAFALINTAP
jgi:protocatechuate 3,4-dioxygenase beta subunit